MTTHNFTPTFLKDYLPPVFTVTSVDIAFDLFDTYTTVTAVSQIVRNSKHNGDAKNQLQLSGRNIPKLISVAIDGVDFSPNRYECTSELLIINDVPQSFTLKIVTEIVPQSNTALEGLYFASGMYCTQCEAEGFRTITYFLDRPDVLAIYTTRITADKGLFPVLLSNGNLVDRGDLDAGRHFVVWKDPFPKPSYLFALVAGDLSVITDKFVTMSGRKVALEIYVESENIDKCGFAMQALKNSFAWDEARFGLEYDLDIFMIVAVSDFNMGAMENKGLNIFNSKYILADPQTATDADYFNIQAVIGHEYFHNWTGNRVTCRDWFQLSLKEGLTVYRDQEFSADMTSPDYVRIIEVEELRRSQFSEDKSPMAHPVRPDSYIEISNFYTATIYSKGAEVIRMMATILGREGFRRGMDLYFKRHDGQAVTTDDFVSAMADANQVDFEQFKRWYFQAGTPQVHYRSNYDQKTRRLTLIINQSIPDTPGQSGKLPHVIPMRTGLMTKAGDVLAFTYNGITANEHVLLITKSHEEIVLENVNQAPIISTFRGFSAPVDVFAETDVNHWLTMMKVETDSFNRYEAAREAAMNEIYRLSGQFSDVSEPKAVDRNYIEAFKEILQDPSLDERIKARILAIPSMDQLMQSAKISNGKISFLEMLYTARCQLQGALSDQLIEVILQCYNDRRSSESKHDLSNTAVGRRALKNRALELLSHVSSREYIDLACEQLSQAQNLTDSLVALEILASSTHTNRDSLLLDFYKKWSHNRLVMDKWFALQAGSWHQDINQHVQDLLSHKDFDLLNPNRVFAVFRSYTSPNPFGFHHNSGKGYELVADYVLKLDRINPSIASRVATPLGRWYAFDESMQNLMKEQLQRICDESTLSKDVYEIVSKGLMQKP